MSVIRWMHCSLSEVLWCLCGAVESAEMAETVESAEMAKTIKWPRR